MSETPQLLKKKAITPLWIVALFVSFTELVLGVAATQTDGGIQLALIVFVLSFPVLIAGAFFLILWHRPYVFYPPTEFGETNVLDYVRAMQGALSEAKEAKREALEAKAEVSEVHQAIQPIVDRETESDPAELSATVQQITRDVTAIEAKLLGALSSGKFTLRSENGLAKEIAADQTEVSGLLKELRTRGLVQRTHVRSGPRGPRWSITEAGRSALKHAEPKGTTGA